MITIMTTTTSTIMITTMTTATTRTRISSSCVLPLPAATPEALQAGHRARGARLRRGRRRWSTATARSTPARAHYAIDISHAGADFTLRVAEARRVRAVLRAPPAGVRPAPARASGRPPSASSPRITTRTTSAPSASAIRAPLDPAKLNQWLDYLLKTRGQDIFRMKGVLNVKGEDRRQVFHGVHMMFDAQAERPWGTTPRTTAWCSSAAGSTAPSSKRASNPPSRSSRWPQAVPVFRAGTARRRRSSTTTSLDCAWAPDGKSLAIAGGEGKVALARVPADSLHARRHRRTLARHAGRRVAAARAPLRHRGPGRRDRAVGCRGRARVQALEARDERHAGTGILAGR